MTNKAFFWLALLALMLGGALGGVLIVVLGDEGADAPAVSALPGPTGDGPSLQRLGELTQQIEAGDADPEDVEELEQIVAQLPSDPSSAQFPGAGDGPRARPGASMIGVVESLDGDVLSVNSPIGPLQATVGDDTAINAISETDGTLEDLTTGLRVTIEVERNEQGVLTAATVRVVPEGLGIPLRGQLAGQQGLEGLPGLGQLSDQQMALLAQQAAIMAAGARRSGSVTVTDEEALAGPPPGALAIPGASRTFSFTAPSQDGSAAPSPALTGVLESVDEGVLELTTPRGPIRATVGPDTTIRIFSETTGKLEDLTPGAQVLISGQPDDTGSLQATAITLLPEGLDIPTGPRFGGQGGFGGFPGASGGGQGGFGGRRGRGQ